MSNRDAHRPRLIDVRRIRAVWWLAVLGLIPLIEAAAAAIAAQVTAAPEDVFAPLITNFANPAVIIALAGFTLMLGPLPEEIGWRGFALDALQARFTPVLSSLILAGSPLGDAIASLLTTLVVALVIAGGGLSGRVRQTLQP